MENKSKFEEFMSDLGKITTLQQNAIITKLDLEKVYASFFGYYHVSEHFKLQPKDAGDMLFKGVNRDIDKNELSGYIKRSENVVDLEKHMKNNIINLVKFISLYSRVEISHTKANISENVKVGYALSRDVAKLNKVYTEMLEERAVCEIPTPIQERWDKVEVDDYHEEEVDLSILEVIIDNVRTQQLYSNDPFALLDELSRVFDLLSTFIASFFYHEKRTD